MELQIGNRGFKDQVKIVDQVPMDNLEPLVVVILEVEALVEASIHLAIFQKLIEVKQEQDSQEVQEEVEAQVEASIHLAIFQQLIEAKLVLAPLVVEILVAVLIHSLTFQKQTEVKQAQA